MAPAQVLPQSVLPDLTSLKLSVTPNNSTNGSSNGSVKYDTLEDYNGQYRFAPIEEAEVSRAMIKR